MTTRRFQPLSLLATLAILAGGGIVDAPVEPETEEERRRHVSRSPASSSGMRGPGEHPPEEDCGGLCGGLCGAPRCIDKAMAAVKAGR